MGLVEESNRELVPRVRFTLEVKEPPQGKMCCPECGGRLKRHGYSNPGHREDAGISTSNPQSFMDKLSTVESLEEKWEIASAGAIRYLHLKEKGDNCPVSGRVGPYKRTSKWLEPLALGLLAVGFSTETMTALINNKFGRGVSESSIQRRSTGAIRHTALEDFVTHLHRLNRQRVTTLTGGWSTHLPPITWNTVVWGDSGSKPIEENTRTFLEKISEDSLKDPRSGTFHFQLI